MIGLEKLEGFIEERDPSQRFYGVVVAIVTNNEDPDELGRVKVSFPWLSTEYESNWARVVTPMAGNEMGVYFLPEVDDEVLVAFEHGRADHPYVLGSLWNGIAKPPQSNKDGKNDVRVIRSRSGHSIILNDNTDNKDTRLEIRSSSGHCILLDDSNGTVVVSDSSGNKITLDAENNTLSIEVSGEESHDVGGDLTINVKGTATISGVSGVVIDSSSIKLGSSASFTLVNDSFLTHFNTHMHVGNMGGPTSPPSVPAVKGVHSTIATKGV